MLLSTPQLDVTEALPVVDGKDVFNLEQCGIPSPVFYLPSNSTGKSPFDSVCNSDTELNIDKSVCKLFKSLALSACSKEGDPQAESLKYYNVFSQERSTIERVCADFNMISQTAKTYSQVEGYELMVEESTLATLYILAGQPSEGSICSLFCGFSQMNLVMCQGLDFLLMTYTHAYQPNKG